MFESKNDRLYLNLFILYFREEEEMLEVKQQETRVEISVDSKQAMANLQFPFEKNVLSAIEAYWKKGFDYLQLGIGSIKVYFMQCL